MGKNNRGIKLEVLNSPIKAIVHTAEEVFEVLGLEEHTLYKVLIQCRSNNPEHTSFLFTGFKNGNYCTLYNNNSDSSHMMELYSLKVVKKLASTDN